MLEKARANRILFNYKVQEKVNNFINEEDKKEEIYSYIREGFAKLKECDIIFTRKDIEFDVKKKCEYPAFTWQERVVALCHIYAPLIGILDYKRDSKIRFSDENYDIKKDLKEIYDVRNKILMDYEKLMTDWGFTISVINEAFKTIPSYEYFNELCNDMVNHGCQINIQAEFISSYLAGYKSKYFDVEDIINKYNGLYTDYNKFKNNNDINMYKVKKLLPKEEVSNNNGCYTEEWL